jgi:hypothetical protein
MRPLHHQPQLNSSPLSGAAAPIWYYVIFVEKEVWQRARLAAKFSRLPQAIACGLTASATFPPRFTAIDLSLLTEGREFMAREFRKH